MDLSENFKTQLICLQQLTQLVEILQNRLTVVIEKPELTFTPNDFRAIARSLFMLTENRRSLINLIAHLEKNLATSTFKTHAPDPDPYH